MPWLFFLLRYAERHGGDGRARVMVEETLRAMRLGGIFDQLGCGFHRYSTDAGWLVPHFEKMLYDQALLALAYTEAFRLWGDAAFRDAAEEIFAYVLRDLRAPDGGFAAAEDADSEGEEGRFYLWSVDEVTALLGPAAAEEFAAAFHMTANGNFTSEVGERSDRNILHRLSPLAIGAGDFTLRAGGLPPALEASRVALLAARGKRVRPHRDDKVLADWNGLMIAALAKAAAVFGEPSLAREAAGRGRIRADEAARRAGESAAPLPRRRGGVPGGRRRLCGPRLGLPGAARRNRRTALAGRRRRRSSTRWRPALATARAGSSSPRRTRCCRCGR